MVSRTERDRQAGRAQQAAANAAAAGTGPRCQHQVATLRSLWVCVRPPHGGAHPHTDQWRRDRGQTPAVDKHYLRRLGPVLDG